MLFATRTERWWLAAVAGLLAGATRPIGLLLVVFVINMVAIQMLLTPKEISDQGVNVLFYFGDQLFGHWAGYVMFFAVITSTVATTQTTLLPAARITLSMSRDHVFPKVFGTIQGKLKTPAVGTLILAFLCLFGILLTSQVTSIQTVFNNLILNIGVLIAFYYGITGLACAWAYRKVAFTDVRFFFTGVLFPLLGGAVLIFVLVKVIIGAGMSGLPVIITMVLGIPLVILARFTSKGDFFKTKMIAYTEIGD